MVLQRLVDVGRLQGVSDCLLDDNNVVMQVDTSYTLCKLEYLFRVRREPLNGKLRSLLEIVPRMSAYT